jgi:glycosyltransferase involved in cell wall biosynthesis
MPKVLFVVPHLSNSMRLLADYLRYLDPAFEVTLFALEPDRRFEHEFPADCRKLFQPQVGRRLALPSMLWNIWRAAKRQDLIVSWMELTPTYLCYAVGKLRRRPVIGWVHANLTRVFELGQRPKKLHGPVMRRIYPRLAAVMGCADGVGDDLRNNFHLANAGAIPNGTDIDRCRKLAEQSVPERLRHVFDRPVIVNVAAFHFQKNQQLLLRAHARLVRELHVDHNLLFVGSGSLEAQLKDLASDLHVADHVFFSGYVDNPYPLIRAARAFVLSSHWEGLPLVVAEALAVGTPVVSTDCPNGPREILDAGRYGTLVPVDNLDAMTRAIHDVLTDDAKHAALRAASSEGAERMSIRPRARQLGELFWRVLKAHGYDRADLPAAIDDDEDERELALTR